MKNVFFINMDAADLESVFGNREAGRIYINFCDPWPSRKHAKRRLTSPDYLLIYGKILKPGGEVHFKTDNTGLFEYSAQQFENNGFELAEISKNLHENGVCTVLTDYESKFIAQGKPIFRLVAILKRQDMQNAPAEQEQLAGERRKIHKRLCSRIRRVNLKLISWNVNGLRACEGFYRFSTTRTRMFLHSGDQAAGRAGQLLS